MLKYIINDYLINLNPRNIKKEDLRNLSVYALILGELVVAMEVDGGIFFYSYMISALIGLAMCYQCGRTIPKIFYLLPISKKEREKYLVIGFRIRLIVPVVLYFLWAGILFFLDRISFLDYLTGFLMLFLCNAAVQTSLGVEKVDGFMGSFQFFIRIVMFGGF